MLILLDHESDETEGEVSITLTHLKKTLSLNHEGESQCSSPHDCGVIIM